MGSTFKNLLDDLNSARDAGYRDDVQRQEMMQATLYGVVVQILEKLRDTDDS